MTISRNINLSIQVLRAFCVLAVIFYHLGFEAFSLGYIGVDIFFVVSGYVICKKISDDIANNDFSLTCFYTSRIFRLLPNLLLMVGVVTVVSYFIFSMSSALATGYSAISAITALSNLYFYFEGNYFSQQNIFKPLLHTWSLSVEEQFYLFFPVLFIIISKTKLNYQILIFSIMTISFALISYLMDIYAQTLNFYFTPSRSYQFLLGVVAYLITQKDERKLFNLKTITLCMIVFILIVFAHSSDKNPVGFFVTLPFMILTFIFLIIRVNLKRNRIVRVFEHIGNMSYALYLWHYPVISFYAHIYGFERGLPGTLICISLIYIFSLSSYIFVEKRFRIQKCMATHKYVAFSLVIIMGIFALVGYAILTKNNLPMYPVSEFNKVQNNQVTGQDAIIEMGFTVDRDFGGIVTKPETSANLKLLVIGDSHAEHLAHGFADFMAEESVETHLVFSTGCSALLGHEKDYDIYNVKTPRTQQKCSEFVKSVDNFLSLRAKNYDLILFASRWNWLVNPSSYGPIFVREDAVMPLGSDPYVVPPSLEKRGADFSVAVEATSELLDNLAVPHIIVGQAPLLYRSPKTCTILLNCMYLEYFEAYAREQKTAQYILTNLYASGFYFSIFDLFCEQGSCTSAKTLEEYYADSNHLNYHGSSLVARELLSKFEIFNDSEKRNK